MMRPAFLLAILSQAPALAEELPFWDRIKMTIEKNLGRPYVWGACGMKGFDCSGFVWRVWTDNGVLMKRTTARKLYLALPKPEDSSEWNFGNLVFFNNLTHVGIVNDGKSFYHAQSSKGTNRSDFDPYWRSHICGFRVIKRSE